VKRWTLLSGAAVLTAACGAAAAQPSGLHTSRVTPTPTQRHDFATGPGCPAQLPYIVNAHQHRQVTLTRPHLATHVGAQVTIAFGLDEFPTTPITDGQLVVTAPGTTSGAGFGSGGPGSFDDSSTHLVTVHYEPTKAPTRHDTRYFSLSFRPKRAGSYPVFNYQASGVTGPCADRGGSVAENVIAWIDAR
jgi:hypothetical protein